MNRREFNKLSLLSGAGLAMGSIFPDRSLGANSKVTVAVAGIRSRGKYLSRRFASIKNSRVKYVIDVDKRYLPDAAKVVEETQGTKPELIRDFRKALDDKDVDALVIATPEHWHAPMTLEAVKAGKSVYVEKPCSHNPAEGEMLVEAQNKYGKLIQMGNQRRSMRLAQQMIKEIHEGIIGKPYLGKTWYARKRGPIGKGKVVPVPDYLNWNLWQGPAPRTDYRDNVHPYNWHWFWRWGTGEVLNNGTHELDIARWALNVDYPTKVSSMGGRYHYPDDDWEFYDTQFASMEFNDDKLITWEGISAFKLNSYGASRGAIIVGTEGRIDYLGNKYKVFDLDGNLIREETKGKISGDQTDTTDPGLDDYHAENFINSIRGEDELTAPVDEARKSILLGHLANIANKTSSVLICDPANGHIKNNTEAQKLWSREYEPGWKPKV